MCPCHNFIRQNMSAIFFNQNLIIQGIRSHLLSLIKAIHWTKVFEHDMRQLIEDFLQAQSTMSGDLSAEQNI